VSQLDHAPCVAGTVCQNPDVHPGRVVGTVAQDDRRVQVGFLLDRGRDPGYGGEQASQYVLCMPRGGLSDGAPLPGQGRFPALAVADPASRRRHDNVAVFRDGVYTA
jgi:hypothetical protein